jgi:hypothetical protein
LWLLCLTAGMAQGHVLWIIPVDKGDSALVVWSDEPRPDNVDEPLTTIARAEVLLRHADGRVETLKWTQDKDAYHVACPGEGPRTVAVTWTDDRNLGVQKALTTYVATTYLADPTGKVSAPEKRATWEQLGPEIVPRPDRGPSMYQLVYKGKPIANTRVKVETSGGEVLPRLSSDKEGLFTFAPPNPGVYGFYALYTAAEALEYNGMRFTQRRYWTSLVIQVPTARDKESPGK